jgi:hypothetical protein
VVTTQQKRRVAMGLRTGAEFFATREDAEKHQKSLKSNPQFVGCEAYPKGITVGYYYKIDEKTGETTIVEKFVSNYEYYYG